MPHAVYPSLVNKTVLVTGGGSGIGADIVAGFVRQKSRVFFLDVNEDAGETIRSKACDIFLIRPNGSESAGELKQ